MEILWLGHPDCHNNDKVGGKAGNLSLLAAKYRVPPGFCFTADSAAPLAQETIASLELAYQNLSKECNISDPAVAVRSSSVDEDGKEASFAGQYETVLNVRGIKPLIDAVVQCLASANSDRIIAYRKQYGLPEDASLTVLIQKMVNSDTSAVCFSVNPITGNKDEIVINSNWGLGESIVSGEVTPDTYILDKAELSIKNRIIAEKRFMTVRTEKGTRKAAVPRILSQTSSLDYNNIIATATLAKDLENEMGWPVDVECAWEKDCLYLLQCRPITTLKK